MLYLGYISPYVGMVSKKLGEKKIAAWEGFSLKLEGSAPGEKLMNNNLPNRCRPYVAAAPSSSTPRLRLGLLLRLLLELDFLLVLLLAGLVLALQALHLLVRLLHRLEKPLEAGLLRRLQVLGQPRGRGAHAVFAEAFFRHEERHQPFHVRRFPFEITFRVVRGSHVGVEEELSRVFVGPVRGDGVAFLRVVFDMRHHCFEGAVVTDQF